MPRNATSTADGRRGPGQLETSVLAALWAADEALTPAEVQARLADGGDDLAYTSVMTTLSRMYAKGILERAERGRAFAYRPTPAAADAAALQMRSLLGAGPARAMVLSRFVAGLAADDEALLQDLLAHASTPSGGGAHERRSPRKRRGRG